MGNEYYSYKRYQLSLNEDDEKQKKIIEYLDSYKAGKQRNTALVKLLLLGIGEKIEIDDVFPNKSHTLISTEARIKKMDGKLDKILWQLINRYGFSDIEDETDTETNNRVADTKENAGSMSNNEDNQVPGQLSFDDVATGNELENNDTEFGSQAGADGSNVEYSQSENVINHEKTLETIQKADEISKELVASAFGMPSPSAQDEATEGIEDDFGDIDIPEDILGFLDTL